MPRTVVEAEQDVLSLTGHARTPLRLIATRSDLQAVAPGIADQHVRRVEAHRLVVEQRRVVLGRVVVPQPGRLVGQHGEGVGVALRKAELGEAQQLLEDIACASRAATPFLHRARR